MSKIRTTDISPAQSSRSLSKFLGKTEQRPETMEHTCSEYLGRVEIILTPVTKITNHIDISWGKRYLEDMKWQVKRKQISPEKCLKVQTKDNLDTQ